MDSDSKVSQPCKAYCCDRHTPPPGRLYKLLFGRERNDLTVRWLVYLALMLFGFAGAVSVPLAASIFYRQMVGSDANAGGMSLLFFWLLMFVALVAVGFSGAEGMSFAAKHIGKLDGDVDPDDSED